MMMLLDLAVVFLPLLGAALAGFGGHRLGDRGAQAMTCVAMTLAAGASCVLFDQVALGGAARTHDLGTWIEMGKLKADWALRFDTLSVVMILVVNLVSTAVHFYSIGYMHDDKSVPRFMAFLSLFTFFMLMLVTADNLLQMFFGWEGVGLSSYLLIGFWFDRPRACAAAIKAFLVNRVGDIGFMLGLFGCYQLFGTLDLDAIFKAAPQAADKMYVFSGGSFHALTVISLLLFVGAMGKSAQIGLHVWLPDAMEGPTPVSALIHAATMVTAGVFLLARLSPLFEYAPTALTFVTWIGAITAVFGACVALTQFDIKRVIAYSTISQLGYMFVAAGVSAYGASVFHLMTHAFFKALLFLGAGCVIHALGGEQDMRRMGGLARKMPYTYAAMVIGGLSLAGIGVPGLFGFSGFYSKDLILEAAFARGTGTGYAAWALCLGGAFMTAFYIVRLMILTFHGESAEGTKELEAAHTQAHHAPWSMLVPVWFLALGALMAGSMGLDYFASAADGSFWRGTLFVLPAHARNLEEAVPVFIKLLPLVMALAGGGFSAWLYLKRLDMHEKIVQKLGPVQRAAANQFYFNEIYDVLFVRSAKRLGLLLHVKFGFFDDLYDFLFVRIVQRLGAVLARHGDEAIIDRFGPDGVALLAQKIGQSAGRAQTGYMPHYAFVMIAGLAVLVGWALMKG